VSTLLCLNKTTTFLALSLCWEACWQPLNRRHVIPTDKTRDRLLFGPVLPSLVSEPTSLLQTQASGAWGDTDLIRPAWLRSTQWRLLRKQWKQRREHEQQWPR